MRLLLLFSLSLLLRAESTLEVITGILETCPARQLDHVPELQAFIESGEFEHYQNINIAPKVQGQEPMLTIYHDGVETEKIFLSEWKEDFHDLMLSKGFELKSDEEIAALQANRDQQTKDAWNQALQSIQDFQERFHHRYRKPKVTIRVRRGSQAEKKANAAVISETGESVKIDRRYAVSQ